MKHILLVKEEVGSMATVVVCLVVAVLVTVSPNAAAEQCSCSEESINRRGFPEGFLFGSASAAYQMEGAYNASGKGPSMWDNFTHAHPEKILDGSNGDVAVDSYHLYKEDVRLLKEMGTDAYKFSISWPRILPGGSISKGVNEDGIKYYNDLINELLANGIQPWITILHLDIPQALQDEYGGFMSPQIVKDFENFADLLFSRFGDRVKNWITINEPWGISFLGYVLGVFAPGRCSKSFMGDGCLGGDSATEPYVITHNQLLSHAAVVKLYRHKYQELQKGKIGVTVNCFWFLPYDNTSEGVKAKDRAFDFMLGWVMDPIAFGTYPESVVERVGARLPKFTQQEAETIKGSFDFIGLNYYSGKYALNTDGDYTVDEAGYMADSGYSPVEENKDGISIGERGSLNSRYNIYPKGLHLMLRYFKLKYNDPLIYVTENGLDEDRDDSIPMSEALKDYKRKNYIYNHLCCLHQAIEQDGVNVKGYFAWSLTDNYEWASGYLVRFGVNYIDFGDKSLTRYPKLSAQWLGSIFAKPQAVGVSDQ